MVTMLTRWLTCSFIANQPHVLLYCSSNVFRFHILVIFLFIPLALIVVCCGLQLKFLWLPTCWANYIINSSLALWRKIPHMMLAVYCSVGKHSAVCTFYWDSFIWDNHNFQGLITDRNVSHNYSLLISYAFSNDWKITYTSCPCLDLFRIIQTIQKDNQLHISAVERDIKAHSAEWNNKARNVLCVTSIISKKVTDVWKLEAGKSK